MSPTCCFQCNVSWFQDHHCLSYWNQYRCTYGTLVFLHCRSRLTVSKADWLMVTSRWVRADQRWCCRHSLNWWGQQGTESSSYLQTLKDSKTTWQMKTSSTPYFHIPPQVMFTTCSLNNSDSLRGEAKSCEIMLKCCNLLVRKGQFSRIKMMYPVLL